MSKADRFLIGLVGDGIQFSRSPDLHHAEAAAQVLAVHYQLIDMAKLGLGFADVADVLGWAERLGFSAFNITHPYKQAVLPLLAELSPEAAVLGAVNTVVVRDGRRIGHNTDWVGFAHSMTEGLPGADLSRVAVIGAGGASAAICYALLSLGAREIRLYDPARERAEALAAHMAVAWPGRTVAAQPSADAACEGVTGIVQTSPIGMKTYPGMPLSADLIPGGIWVADIIYTPAETEFLKAATARGCATMSGIGMVIAQAAKSFEVFTGRSADLTRMRAVLADQTT